MMSNTSGAMGTSSPRVQKNGRPFDRQVFTGRARLNVLAAILAGGLACAAANGAVTVIGVQYQPDRAFPEHECFWHESQFPGPCSASSLGANVHVYLRNTGPSAVTVQDVTFAGFSLQDLLSLHYQVAKRQPASIWLESLSSGQLQTLVSAGEPVWFKIDPASIPVGGTGQVVVRLRSVPVTQPVTLSIVTSGGTLPATIPVEANAPQVASVGFSTALSKVYLYWRRVGGTAPTSILMDGTDVTANSTTVSDPAAGLVVTVLQPPQPLIPSSYHVFQGTYADGKTASAGLRAWVNKFIYGSWGGAAVPDGDDAAARAALIDFTNHGMNGLVQNGSSVTSVLMKTLSGQQFVAAQDYGFVIDDIGTWSAEHPLMWFIRDEPDAADSRVDFIPSDKKVGSLAQMALQRGEELREGDPLAPTTLNIDGTYKPYNLYNYGQVPDVLMTDPYYQARLREASWYYPQRIPLYQKGTYIYAVSQLAASTCEPNPLHVILYSCEWKDSSGAVFPYPTPESKRIEVYYALAGGAKGLAYWWFNPGQPSNGLGDGSLASLALWKEIGLLGNEIKTAAPLLVTSCPMSVNTQVSTGVWARTLAVGDDTMILLAVNDQYLNDEQGCHYTPVANASATLTLPTWLAAPSAFEISAGGLSDVTTQLNAGQLQVSLGTLNLTRMIVLTTNPQLRATIQQRYDEQVEAAVCAFAPEVCSQAIPPTITQQPLTHSSCAGTTATVTVGAAGPGTLTYQWQKNQVDLVSGPHYGGINTPTLSIFSSTGTDTANYRCVVTNAHGSVTSAEAALTIIACNPGCLQNLSFEGGFTNGIGNGWTKFIRIGSVTCSSETTEVHGGSHSQEVYAPNKNNDGGVYQQLTATVGQPYIIKAWIKVFTPQGAGSAEGFFGIDPTGGTDPNSVNILWASKPWEYWSQESISVTAQNSVVTVYLRGRATRNNTTAYVWLDDVEVAPGHPTDLAPQVFSPTSIRWRWTDLAIETGYRVRDDGGVDKSGLLAQDTAQWLEATGLTPNTQYTRQVYAINDCGESDASGARTVRTLSIPPASGSITPSTSSPNANESVVWTAVGGFGPGKVQYYRYAWDQSSTHDWTGLETQWSTGTISTSPTGIGAWYLHVQGYNGDNVSNGTYDYDVTVAGTVVADLDEDHDVDLADFALFDFCVSGPAVPFIPGCENRDFDDDNDVDLSDFGIFQRCFAGENVPPDSHCAD